MIVAFECFVLSFLNFLGETGDASESKPQQAKLSLYIFSPIILDVTLLSIFFYHLVCNKKFFLKERGGGKY